MGDRQGRMKPGGGILLNGILPGEDATATQFLDAERWSLAEERTAQLIACIQPNKPSEERRHAVANYVQRLITQSFSCEVFTFGSVPLKTYLPDGDIDLTAFSQNTDSKDTWANAVLKVLENEEKSETAEFHVKEVQYIQAEVKIIKCLVENIVVDISFNQLGGLCTLCFLDEVDHLINQDHMFKRSIILIKAWCYYESRILGAHHGLISTYALETLVLYIFHVFNNSFSGPLEVLFRFLEFFSKFDWENFCVSLSGPVPINSLPDMTAECPRKDGGELLLNKLFLNGCSSVYAVYPHGQENQGQPFVSKHFNVVDPLRTNNNLGRSVSKGNFYRIRSAFAFGAKRLAGMLSCPKENIVVEVDKFFLNTWNRHGTGKRPDAPVCSVSLQLPPSNITPVPYVDKLQNSASTKHMAESYRLIANHRNSGAVVNDVASVPVNSANGTGQSLDKNVDTNILDSSIGYGLQAMSGMANHIHRNVSANEFVYTEMLRKNLRPGHFYPSGQGRFQFARTHSSPELTDPSHGILTPQIGVAETENKQSGCLKEKSSKDSSSPKYSCAHSGAGMVPDTSSDHDDAVFLNTKEHASVSQNLELRQEEQDFVNTMPSSRFHGYNGQYQQTIQCSPHPPIHSQLSAAAYSQRTIGAIPGNMPPVETRWGSNIQLHQVLVPSPASGYFGNAHLDSNASETGEYTNDRSSTTSIDLDNGDHGFSHDLDVALSRGFASENRKSQVPSADDRKVPSAGVNFPPCSEGNSKFHNLRGQSRFIRETGRPLKSDHLDISMIRNPRENGPYSHNRSENFRPDNYTKAGFSKKLGSESWDGPMAKGSKFSREKRGRKIPSSTEVPSSYARKSGWSSESSSVDGVPACTDDYGHGGVLNHEPNADDLAQQSIDSSAQMSVNHQVAGPDQMFMSGSDPVFPVTPMIVYGNPRPRRGSSSGMGSVAVNFFQTGPPVPFYVVQYKGPPDPPTSDASVEQFNEIDSSHLTSSVRSLDLTDRSEEHDPVLPSTSVEDAFEKFPEGNKDILYSDFSSHWQNLQYGRLCQDSNIPGPPVYPSPLVVPPMYLQGQFQWDGPGRPGPTIAPLMNYAHRLVPFVPLHPGPNRPDVCQRYGDETHRFRSGTGTYLPKTKLPYRERQSSIPRNNRGNHNYERYNNGDREGSWVNQKSRISYNNPGRHQHDRPNTRTDRSLPVDSQPGRSWDTHETERVPSNRHNTALISSNSNDISSTMAYSMYPLASVSSSNVNAGASVPSLMMLYQYDSSIGYRSPEQVEFGSIGSVHLGGLNEMQHAGSANALRGSSENRGDGYQQGSASSSPDQPSSPQFHSRRI